MYTTKKKEKKVKKPRLITRKVKFTTGHLNAKTCDHYIRSMIRAIEKFSENPECRVIKFNIKESGIDYSYIKIKIEKEKYIYAVTQFMAFCGNGITDIKY